MTNEKPVLYTNPARKNINEENISHCRPQYQSLGIEPVKSSSGVIPGAVLGTRDNSSDDDLDNPRLRKLSIRQENNSVPNIGNNMEHVWSGVDAIIDDISDASIDINEPMIDNNYMDAEYNVQTNKTNDLSSLNDNDYVLIVNETIISIGSFEEIQANVGDLVFGEHKLCGGESIPIENILVLKKVNIKVGVFLE
jgi:hypothetical protein